MNFTDATTVDLIALAWSMNNALDDLPLFAPAGTSKRVRVGLATSFRTSRDEAIALLRIRADHGDDDADDFLREVGQR